MSEPTDIPSVQYGPASAVRGVRIVPLKVVRDPRGDLMVGEFERQVPFTPARFFAIFGVPDGTRRGEHAHLACHQFLICLRGSCTAIVDDGRSREEVPLTGPGSGLYMPPMTWGTQYRYSADALLLVFASHLYDPADYVRTYDEFRSAVAAQRSPMKPV